MFHCSSVNISFHLVRTHHSIKFLGLQPLCWVSVKSGCSAGLGSRDSYHLRLGVEASFNTIFNPVYLKMQTLSSYPEGSLWEVNQHHSLETVTEQVASCPFTEKKIFPSSFFEPGNAPISSTTYRQVHSSLCIDSYDKITCTQIGDVDLTS